MKSQVNLASNYSVGFDNLDIFCKDILKVNLETSNFHNSSFIPGFSHIGSKFQAFSRPGK